MNIFNTDNTILRFQICNRTHERWLVPCKNQTYWYKVPFHLICSTKRNNKSNLLSYRKHDGWYSNQGLTQQQGKTFCHFKWAALDLRGSIGTFQPTTEILVSLLSPFSLLFICTNLFFHFLQVLIYNNKTTPRQWLLTFTFEDSLWNIPGL